LKIKRKKYNGKKIERAKNNSRGDAFFQGSSVNSIRI